ncbi:MAG: helix-turn-helix domain-containing protein [Ferruginibacter sp.]
MNSRNKIPNYTLAEQAKKGVLIAALRNAEVYQKHSVSKPHRDDHIIVLITSSGKFELNIDFEIIKLTKPSILLIFPEQVHNIIKIEKAEGWLMNIEPSVIYPEIANMLYEYLDKPAALGKEPAVTKQLFSLLQTVEALSGESPNIFIEKTIHLTVNAVLSLMISSVLPNDKALAKNNRAAIIYKQFKALLEQHFKTWKQPSQYASEISITTTHLNDTVKEQTGLTVTAHIQNRSILEARRLLFFTDNSVSEISYETGYNDPVYFGKLFKSLTGLTPLSFRKKFRE